MLRSPLSRRFPLGQIRSILKGPYIPIGLRHHIKYSCLLQVTHMTFYGSAIPQVLIIKNRKTFRLCPHQSDLVPCWLSNTPIKTKHCIGAIIFNTQLLKWISHQCTYAFTKPEEVHMLSVQLLLLHTSPQSRNVSTWTINGKIKGRSIGGLDMCGGGAEPGTPSTVGPFK